MAINLIPQEQEKETQENALKRGITFGITLLVLSLVLLGGRYFYEAKRLSDMGIEEASIKSDEDSLKEYKDSLEKYKNHPALQILSNHTYYTQFLNKVEECVPANMQILSMKIDGQNKVAISASIKGEYADVASFIKTLKENGLSNIKLGAMSKTNDMVSFGVDFDFQRNLILK